MESNENLLVAELQIDTTAHAYLAETAKWGNFLGILGFILSGIIGIAALFAGTLMGSLSNTYGAAVPLWEQVLLLLCTSLLQPCIFSCRYIYTGFHQK